MSVPESDPQPAHLPTKIPGGDDDLPPVEPPSAGFLVQLFLVPGVIVLVIVAVWALFGKLAAGEQNWQRQLTELRSENEHRRWRAAYGLAQILQNDQELGEKGEKLSYNPQIANTLTELLSKELEKKRRDEVELKNLIFFTRTLGYLDTHDTVLPVLLKTIDNENDREVRKVAIAAVTMIAGRAANRNAPLKDEEVSEAMVKLSQESDDLYRQMAAFTMGSLRDEETLQRLLVLVEDADQPTRIDAAISLARRENPAGYPVFLEILERSVKSEKERFGELNKNELQNAKAQEFLMLKNSLQAIGDLKTAWNEEQKRALVSALTAVEKNYSEDRIQVNASKLLKEFSK